MFKVAALYNFTSVTDPGALQADLRAICRTHGIRGTLIVAHEGINGTIAGTVEAIDAILDWLASTNSHGGLLDRAEIKFSTAANMPFNRLKIRVKPEIVTLRAPEADPIKRVGTYVAAEDWNDLITQEDVILIDTRNDYEVALGTFEGARDPGTKSFVEFKDFVTENLDPKAHKRIAMFCTGGIRCEKASAYMLSQGFEEVYHLKGGILNYLESMPADQSLWQGECFVFDERVSVGHGLVEREAELCRCCRTPLAPADRRHPDFIAGEQCPHCAGPEFQATREAARERNRQMELAALRGLAHLGDDAVAAAGALAAAKRSRREADRRRNPGA